MRIVVVKSNQKPSITPFVLEKIKNTLYRKIL